MTANQSLRDIVFVMCQLPTSSANPPPVTLNVLPVMSTCLTLRVCFIRYHGAIVFDAQANVWMACSYKPGIRG